ncbi:MAG: hypothetical protein ACFFCL_16040 [Promethearchaeota archaeon]
MKRENMNFKKKYKKSIEVYSRDYNLNPELLKVKKSQGNFIDKRGSLKKLNYHSNNSKINSNRYSKIVNHNIGMNARIKHRKKREGD